MRIQNIIYIRYVQPSSPREMRLKLTDKVIYIAIHIYMPILGPSTSIYQSFRFVLVFNCDENFDLKSMGRIFLGLCQVGAWGCFDEFNRLEERILSAVSQQILTIQQGLLQQQKEIQLIGENVRLNPNVGIFVTMNPGRTILYCAHCAAVG
jgi:hypothetical protein